jgi:hypothetical protein
VREKGLSMETVRRLRQQCLVVPFPAAARERELLTASMHGIRSLPDVRAYAQVSRFGGRESAYGFACHSRPCGVGRGGLHVR